jgi:hypothetical protein
MSHLHAIKEDWRQVIDGKRQVIGEHADNFPLHQTRHQMNPSIDKPLHQDSATEDDDATNG